VSTTTEAEEVLTEAGKQLSCHIYLNSEGYQRILKLAKYAVVEKFIEGHPRGNFSQYTNFAYTLAEEFLRQHAARKRQIH
jgi:hypothetical protein